MIWSLTTYLKLIIEGSNRSKYQFKFPFGLTQNFSLQFNSILRAAAYVSRIEQRSEATEIHNVASKKDDHAIIMISSKPFMIVICHRTTKNHWWVQVIFAMFLKQNCVKASNTFSRQINFLLYVLLLPFFLLWFLIGMISIKCKYFFLYFCYLLKQDHH